MGQVIPTPPSVGVGDMEIAIYDPTAVAGDAFDFANMSGAAPMSTGAISGAGLTRPTAATVEIAAGAVRSEADVADIRWAAPLTATITTSGANGLDTGAEASSTWYDVYVIDGPAVAVAALLVVATVTPTMPAGYTVRRRVGIVRNNASSDLIDFSQGGSAKRVYLWLDAVSNRVVLSGGNAATPTVVSLATYVPPRTIHVIVTGINASTTQTLNLYRTTGGAIVDSLAPTSAAGSPTERELRWPVSSQTMAYGYGGTGGSATIRVRGFVDNV